MGGAGMSTNIYESPLERQLADALAEVEQLRAAARAAMDELGVPEPGYLQPVANAYEIFVIGSVWAISVFVAAVTWTTRFGFPHSKGHASAGACAITAMMAVTLGAVFLVVALSEAVRG